MYVIVLPVGIEFECIIILVQLAWLFGQLLSLTMAREQTYMVCIWYMIWLVLFVRFVSCIWISQLWFFNGFWILSALFIHQLGIHLGILSTYLGPFSFVSYIPAMHHIFQLSSYWSWVHCVHPYFWSWVQMCLTCTILSDSALQFRPSLAIMQCLILSF